MHLSGATTSHEIERSERDLGLMSDSCTIWRRDVRSELGVGWVGVRVGWGGVGWGVG